MRLLINAAGALLLAAVIFLLFLLVFEDRVQLPAWLQVIGRMHPMFLHFPITLLLVYFVVFWIPASDASSSWVRVIGFLAAFSAVVTAVMGLLLSLQETPEGATFERHKWGGVSIALAAVVFFYLHSFFLAKKNIVRPLTIVFATLILVTGHWGGNLTHGENYLLEPYAKLKQAVPLEQAVAFADVVLPVFQRKCATCHSGGNSKGGLVLTDSAGVMAGGKTGPLFIPGDPVRSLFIERALLPADHKKHMAPASKPQLTDDELLLLSAWVKAGAPFGRKIIDLPVQDSFRLMASHSLSPAAGEQQTAYNFKAADEKLIQSLNNNYRLVTPLDLHSPALKVQFYGAAAYSSASLEELTTVREQVVDLGLARMPVSNDQLKSVARMPNLRRLNLNYTNVSDEGLQQLTGLKNLEEIAISGTTVSAAVLGQLAKLPSLAAIYIWNTHIDSGKIAVLQNKYKNVLIETGYADDGNDKLPLNPPVAQTPSGVYAPGTEIKLTHPLKGVEIRYTLDGREPDSVHSAVYERPLVLDSFAVIKAKAFKPKWYGSKSFEAVYFMKGVKPDSVNVAGTDDGIRPKGPLLFDLETGDGNLGSGKWVEFRNELFCNVFFNEPKSFRQVSMSMFADGEGLRLPEKIEVWAGADDRNLKLVKIWTPGVASKEKRGQTLQPNISFTASNIRCLRLVFHPEANKKDRFRCLISELILQ